MSHQHIVVSTEGNIGLVTLNRPEVLNALNRATMDELVDALEAFDRDDAVGCVVLTGTGRAFAAGADVKEMATATAAQMLSGYRFQQWERIRAVTKPLIAAVHGYAFGGGCELAMLCDMIVAAETAQFGQAEAWGLVTRVVTAELYLEEAKRLAHEIASKPAVAVRLAKQAILKAHDTHLEGGLDYERKCFYLLFATEDRTEGINAFLEKRQPHFKG